MQIESVDANSVEEETPEEHVRASARIAAKRGFASLAVGRDEAGSVLTPPGFADDVFHMNELEAPKWRLEP